MRSSRSRPKPSPSHRFDAIGTGWQIDTADPLPAVVSRAVAERCEEFDRTWSRFREDSLVRRIGRTPGRYRLPPEASALLDIYRVLYEATSGAVSPLVGRALEQWGYDSAYRLRPDAAISPIPAWEDALYWDGEQLETIRPVVLDIGAVGKGCLVDLVGDLLEAGGIGEFTIDASGDILHRGRRPLRVALEHPMDTTLAVGVARLRAGALCASAANRRAWPGAHHVIDAVTGLPTSTVLATWVTASSAAVADGIATALFFASPDVITRLATTFGFEWVRMPASGALEHSAGFDGEVFT